MKAINQKSIFLIKKFHPLLHKRANIWLTTIAVLGVVVVVMFLQVFGMVYDQNSSLEGATLFNTSNAGAVAAKLTQRGLLGGIVDAAKFAVIPNSVLSNLNQGGSQTLAQIQANANSNPATSGGSILNYVSGVGYAIGGRPTQGDYPYVELPTGTCPGFDAASVESLSAPTITQGRQGSLANVPNLLLATGSDPGNGLAFSSTGYQGGGGKPKVQMDYISQYGDGKTASSWFGPGHSYAAIGDYNLQVNAWYLCWGAGTVDAHGRPSTDGVDLTKPLHMGPHSPPSIFPITVVTPEDAADALLGGPHLIIKNATYANTAGGVEACQGIKCADRFQSYDKGGPEWIQVMSLSFKNVSDQATTVSKLMFDDTSVFVRQSVEKVRLKNGSTEIGNLSWPIQTACGRQTFSDPNAFSNNSHLATITLTTPLAIAPHQTQTLDMEAHIRTASCNGRLIPADISHQFCIAALELPGQAIPTLDNSNYTTYYRAGGGNTVKGPDGNPLYKTTPGCGRSFVMRNNPDTSLDQHSPDVGSAN